MSQLRLRRRTFLRGIGGVAVALPFLEVMTNGKSASADPAALPKRFLLSFTGSSMGGDGDPSNNELVPDATGFGYDLKTALAPFGDTAYNVRDKVSVVSGLKIPWAAANGGVVPAGGRTDNFHNTMMSPLLTGMRAAKNDNSDFGVSSDQIVAAAIGGKTTFASLVYTVQASFYVANNAPYGRDILSHVKNASGDVVDNPGEHSPHQAYLTLFTGFKPTNAADAAKAALELKRRGTVLDLVGGHASALLPKLGKYDRDRLTQHFDEIRALEMRLAATPVATTPTCKQLTTPNDPTVGVDNGGLSSADPMYNSNAGYSDEDARAKLFTDLIAMAFTCDLSRSIAFQYTMAQSHMNMHTLMPDISADLHEMGHGASNTHGVSRAIAWHTGHFARLVAALRDTPEGNGSVLDNAALVMHFNGGHGFDPESGNDNSSHSTENMAALIAGGAGGLVPGQHVVADAAHAHPANVSVSAMKAVGAPEALGEISGAIAKLFAT